MNQHVSFQLRCINGLVATLVATVRILSIMLKHVHFEVFGHLEGEIAQNTVVRFFCYLYIHLKKSVQLVLLNCCLIY